MYQEKHRGNSAPTKPAGGYIAISTITLALLWWSFSTTRLSLRALRVGLALFELRMRRAAYLWSEKKQGRAPEFTPRYSTKELGHYCGLPDKRVKAALEELQALGLLIEFSAERIVFARSVNELTLTQEERSEFWSWFNLLTKRKRVPVPRRILALACESSSPALIAVILGVCLRCCYRKADGFSFAGRVSCTWLASRFRLSLRPIQKAKTHLVDLRWIKPTGDINRFGETVIVNPDWVRIAATREAHNNHHERAGEAPSQAVGRTNSTGVSPPVSPPNGTKATGFSLTESLPPGEIKYQDERESRGRSRPENSGPGVSIPRTQKEKPQDHSGEFPPPRLSSIQPADFRDVGRALELFRQAVKCGLMPNASEHSRLLWLAAIERARTVPAKNPAGVFLYIVKHRRWDFLSDGHFDGANARLKAYLHGPRPENPPLLVPVGRKYPAAGSRPRLSKDAMTLQVIRNHGVRDPEAAFPTLRAHGWDRPRFAAAKAELEGRAYSLAGGEAAGVGSGRP
jgi:hypothetical protein